MYICPILSYSITIHNVHFDISSLLAFASHSISRPSGSRWRLKPDIQSKNWKLISGNQGKGLIQRFWSMCARRTESFGNLWQSLAYFGNFWHPVAKPGNSRSGSGNQRHEHVTILCYYLIHHETTILIHIVLFFSRNLFCSSAENTHAHTPGLLRYPKPTRAIDDVWDSLLPTVVQSSAPWVAAGNCRSAYFILANTIQHYPITIWKYRKVCQCLRDFAGFCQLRRPYWNVMMQELSACLVVFYTAQWFIK